MWKRLDVLDFKHPQIRFPSLVLEQWIIIGADSPWPSIATGHIIGIAERLLIAAIINSLISFTS
jgi:hypothetical protein